MTLGKNNKNANIGRPLRIALLCNYYENSAGTIIDHIMGMADLSRHDIIPINMIKNFPHGFDINRFDGLIIHYSLIACSYNYIAPHVRTAIAAFKGLKIAFVQDDYRFINNTVNALAYMQINILFGLAGPDIIDEVYSPEKLPGVRRETVLAGYVPEHLLGHPVPPYAERPLDVGYRARKLPAWLGSHGQEKWIIADRFLKDAPAYDLKCDISCREEDRLYGDAWIGFLTSCKAVLGTESGAGVCDFTGKIQIEVEAHEARDPNVSFETLRELYFKDEDNRIMMNVISPRCFEAAALRTLMILYDGHYSGRMQAGRHYLSLHRDHSNMDEIVAVLRDPVRAQEIIDNAYNEVANNPANWFRAMVEQVDTAIDETATPAMLSDLPPYTAPELRKLLRRSRSAINLAAPVVRMVARAINVSLLMFPKARRDRLRDTMRSWYWWSSTVRRAMRYIKAKELMSPRIQAMLRKIAHLEPAANYECVAAVYIRHSLAQIRNARMHLAVEGATLRIVTGCEGPSMMDRAALRKILPQIDLILWEPDHATLPNSTREYPFLAKTGQTDPDLIADLLLWIAAGSETP